MSAKNTSSKRSATSKSSPRDVPELFIDRDAWSRKLGQALDDACVAYVAHHKLFDSESPDVEWIKLASQRGWIAITRDQNIRRKPNELAAIRASRVAIFVFTSGNLSAEASAGILLRALPRIHRVARGAKRPCMFSIRRDGSVGRLRL